MLFVRVTSNGAIGVGPLTKILNIWPSAIVAAPPEAVLFVITMEIFFGEVSGQKELPPTIATDVTSKSCENRSGEWNKNIKKNILRKCLISFLILISFNVLQN